MELNLDDIQANQLELLETMHALLKKCYIKKSGKYLRINSTELLQLSEDGLREKLNNFFSQFQENIIYNISIETFQETERIQNVFDNYKTKKKHSLSKINFPSGDWIPSGRTLYVGSSKGSNLKTRMKNHFGVGSKTVYSLHLKHWIPEDLKANIIVEIFQVERPENTLININLLELIEQGFWDELKPMFGKRSGLL